MKLKHISMVIFCWTIVGLSSRNPCHIQFIAFFSAMLSEYSWWTTYLVRKVDMLMGRLPATVVLVDLTDESVVGIKMSNGSFHVSSIWPSDMITLDKVTQFVEDHHVMLDRYRRYHGTTYLATLRGVFKHAPSFTFDLSYDVAGPILMLSIPTVLFCACLLHLRRKTIVALQIAHLTSTMQEITTDSEVHRIKLDTNEKRLSQQTLLRKIYGNQATSAVKKNGSIELVRELVDKVRIVDDQIADLEAERKQLQETLAKLTRQMSTLQAELAGIRART